eukprot:gene9490-19723_t
MAIANVKMPQEETIKLDNIDPNHSLKIFRIGESGTLDYQGRHYYFFTIDPALDIYVSKEMLATGGNWEKSLNDMFRYLWTHEGKISKGHVLDIGVNLGAFTMYAASLGCKLWTFEMQPMLYTMVDMSLRLSGYRQRIHMFNTAVWYKSGLTFSFDPLTKNYGGTFLKQEKNGKNLINTSRIDELYPHDFIFFLKIDIESSEPFALLGMNEMFQKRNIKHFVIELIFPDILSVFYTIGYMCRVFDNKGACEWPNLHEECYMGNYSAAIQVFNKFRRNTDLRSHNYIDVHCTMHHQISNTWPYKYIPTDMKNATELTEYIDKNTKNYNAKIVEWNPLRSIYPNDVIAGTETVGHTRRSPGFPPPPPASSCAQSSLTQSNTALDNGLIYHRNGRSPAVNYQKATNNAFAIAPVASVN